MESIEQKQDFEVVDNNMDETECTNNTHQHAQQQLHPGSGCGDDTHTSIDDTRINNNDNLLSSETDVYEENCINLSLLDPSRYGWMAIGGMADLTTPHERDRRKSRRSQTSSSSSNRRISNKRSRSEAFSESRRSSSIKNGTLSNRSNNGKLMIDERNLIGRQNSSSLVQQNNNVADNNCASDWNESNANPLATITETHHSNDNDRLESISSINDRVRYNNPLLKDPKQTTVDDIHIDTNEKRDSNKESNQYTVTSTNVKTGDNSSTQNIAAMQQQSNHTIDIFAYHLGREKFDPRNTKHFSDDIKPMIVTITLDVPISDPSEDLSSSQCDFFRETMQWDLSDVTMPNPIIVAAQIGERFGLTYPMIWDLAHSIQGQLQNYVNDNCSYTSPTFDDPGSVESGQDSRRAVTTVPQLYGEVTGFTQVGGVCTLPIVRRKAPPVTHTTAHRAESLASTGRSLSGSQRSITTNGSSRQQANAANRARPKQEPAMAVKYGRVVPKLPISEFPREVHQGMDMDYGFDVDYRTLFKAEGSFLVTNDTPATTKTPSTMATQPDIQLTLPTDDGSVDFCNVCKKVGSLLCCDFCPRAFHCQCISSDSTPESMNDESKWECPSCVLERNGLPDDKIAEAPMFDELVDVYHVNVDEALSAQYVTVLGIIHEMLRILMNYDFGNVFRSPVDCNEISTYNTIVKNPMDLGIISMNLEKGHYKGRSLESTVLAILKDIELVWHNCFIFNVEGSAVYRMAKIHKQRAFRIRQSSFDHMISDRVKNDLADYVSTLELERDNHRRLDALTTKSRQSTTITPSVQSRHKFSGPFKSNAKGRSVAVLDSESGRIMKIYSSMQGATHAANFICNMKRHECEWDDDEIETLNKMRQFILKSHTNPAIRLFGYRWICLDELRKRRVKFANPKSTICPPLEDEIQEETVKEELVELVYDGKSFLFYSIDEALSFPDLRENATDLHDRLEALVSGTDYETIDGNMWKRSDLDDLESCGIEYIKEDTICGNPVILCGFLDLVAAHKDWSQTLSATLTSVDDVCSLDVFSRLYLDQDRTVDGMRWRRLPSRYTDDDNQGKAVTQNKSNGSCDVTINTGASTLGIRQETSSTDTHSTNNSNVSHVYDLETVPSPNRKTVLTSPLKRSNGFKELESSIPNIQLAVASNENGDSVTVGCTFATSDN